MLYTDVGFAEVETASDLPPQLDVGVLYFVKDVAEIKLNHGDAVITYGGLPYDKLRYMAPTNFGTTTPTQSDLTSYTLATTTLDAVGDKTVVLNTYDMHMWMYNGTQQMWVDMGIDIAVHATSDVAGVVKGSTTESGKVKVEPDGTMTVINMPDEQKLAALAASTATASNPVVTVNDVKPPDIHYSRAGTPEGYADFMRGFTNYRNPPVFDPVLEVETVAAGGGYYSCVLTPDGKVVFIPYSAARFGVYDLATKTYTSGVVVTGSNKFLGGVLAQNGKIICVPHDETHVGIYDYLAGTYTTGPVVTSTTGAFIGGVLAPNGKVIFAPTNHSNVGIYDPVTNTYEDGPVVSTASGKFSGCVLAANGKIVMVPHDASVVGLYDYENNTYSAGASVASSIGKFRGGVLTASGKIVFVPHKYSNIGVYDVETDTYVDGPAIAGSNKFWGGILTPGNKVIMAAYAYNALGIYDPVVNAYVDGPTTGGSNKYASPVLTPDGQVVFTPSFISTVDIYNLRGCHVDINYCLHPYLNKF